ncbi:MAG: class I SAM-dependent methyltransferase [Solirubrobacteraceae bacterium]
MGAEDSDQAPAPDVGWLRLPDTHGPDVSVKPVVYLPIYEQLLAEYRQRSFVLLELGVWRGDSLEMWRDCFPRATIIGVDLNAPELDLGRRVKIISGDQSDAELLARVRGEHAPEGFDVIIDDASHVGELSARSLKALYGPHLRPGGLYVIEDWGTGYVTSWPDGAQLASPVGVEQLDTLTDGHRFESHDSGLVGLIKRLVDHTAALTLSVHQPERVEDPLGIEWMRIHDGLVILRKPETG